MKLPKAFTIAELAFRLGLSRGRIIGAIDRRLIDVDRLGVSASIDAEPPIAYHAAVAFAIAIGRSPDRLSQSVRRPKVGRKFVSWESLCDRIEKVAAKQAGSKGLAGQRGRKPGTKPAMEGRA